MTLPQVISRLPRLRLNDSPLAPARKSAHLVGICGSGMKALAELLLDLNWNVSGSDLQQTESIQHLETRGLQFHRGHDLLLLGPETDVLVYSTAVKPDNPERQRATELDIPQYSYSEMVGLLMQDRQGVCVAGTHGKSTTTAMTATILRSAGVQHSALIGAELQDSGLSGWSQGEPYFVVESCEYQRNFLEYSPQHAVILGVEPDHFDCYENFEDTCRAFSDFAAKVPEDGLILVRDDCGHAGDAVSSCKATVHTFSTVSESDWWAADFRKTTTGTRFRVFFQRQFFTEVTLQLPGRHNMMNALAATALCHHLGVEPDAIREALHEFQGIRRRYEHRGSWRGVTLIDDYAHHPTAVQATLKAARDQFQNRRITCAFQPHQVSRTEPLLDEFAASFDLADDVLLLPIYAAREHDGELASRVLNQLAERIEQRGQKIQLLPSLDHLIATLENETLPGGVLITMGAGNIDRVHDEFTRRLRRHHRAG